MYHSLWQIKRLLCVCPSSNTIPVIELHDDTDLFSFPFNALLKLPNLWIRGRGEKGEVFGFGLFIASIVMKGISYDIDTLLSLNLLRKCLPSLK